MKERTNRNKGKKGIKMEREVQKGRKRRTNKEKGKQITKWNETVGIPVCFIKQRAMTDHGGGGVQVPPHKFSTSAFHRELNGPENKSRSLDHPTSFLVGIQIYRGSY
jgi:hypothetical protein